MILAPIRHTVFVTVSARNTGSPSSSGIARSRSGNRRRTESRRACASSDSCWGLFNLSRSSLTGLEGRSNPSATTTLDDLLKGPVRSTGRPARIRRQAPLDHAHCAAAIARGMRQRTRLLPNSFRAAPFQPKISHEASLADLSAIFVVIVVVIVPKTRQATDRLVCARCHTNKRCKAS